MSLCECSEWESFNVMRDIATGHHERCALRPDDNRFMNELIERLLNGIELWAGEEDGIHNDLWDDYVKAKSWCGQYVNIKENI